MKRYEGLFILNTAAKEETLKDTIDKLSSEITTAGGKVETVQKMDRRNFSRVADKKHSAGFYVNVIFESLPAVLPHTLVVNSTTPPSAPNLCCAFRKVEMSARRNR